jgi:hypothetical protein
MEKKRNFFISLLLLALLSISAFATITPTALAYDTHLVVLGQMFAWDEDPTPTIAIEPFVDHDVYIYINPGDAFEIRAEVVFRDWNEPGPESVYFYLDGWEYRYDEVYIDDVTEYDNSYEGMVSWGERLYDIGEYDFTFNIATIMDYYDWWGWYSDYDTFYIHVIVSEEPSYYWGQSISWTETYGAGSAVNNPGNMLDDPDENYGQLYAPNYGCLARVSVVLNDVAHGNIQVYGYSVSGYYSLFYVYVSNDDYNWNLVSSQVVSSSSPHWIDFGTYASNFRYVLLIGYDNGNSVNLHIDAVRVTP